MQLLNTYFTYMKDPSRGTRELLQNGSLRQAYTGYLVAALSWVIFFNAGSQISLGALLLKLLIVFLMELTAGYFLAAFCGLFLDLRKIKVSSAQLFMLVGSAGFIKSILIAFALISAAFPQAHLGWLSILVFLFVWGWQLVYLIQGVQRMWQIELSEAIGGWLFGLVPVCVLFGLLGIFFIWFLVILF